MNRDVGIPAQGWIREKELLASNAIPFSRTKLREEVAAGRFPKPKYFTPRTVAYSCQLVHEWIRQQEAAPPEQNLKFVGVPRAGQKRELAVAA